MKTHYQTLKAWRDCRDLTQREAAKRLGLAQGQYSKIERGIRAPRPPKAKRISDLTGVPIESVLGLV